MPCYMSLFGKLISNWGWPAACGSLSGALKLGAPAFW